MDADARRGDCFTGFQPHFNVSGHVLADTDTVLPIPVLSDGQQPVVITVGSYFYAVAIAVQKVIVMLVEDGGLQRHTVRPVY